MVEKIICELRSTKGLNKHADEIEKVYSDLMSEHRCSDQCRDATKMLIGSMQNN